MAATDITIIRQLAKSTEEQRVTYESFKESLRLSKTHLKKVNSSRRIGKKMIAAGLFLTVAIPDPVTDLVGWPLLALGIVTDRVYSHIGIKDAYKEMNRLMKELADVQKI